MPGDRHPLAALSGFPNCARPVASTEVSPYDPSMRRAELLEIIAARKDELRALGVDSLAVFGSVARDEASPTSDVDLLVSFERPVGLLHFFRVQRHLEEMLRCRVDLVMRDAIKPQLRTRILAEAVDAA